MDKAGRLNVLNKNLNCDEVEIKIYGQYPNHLRFVDDIIFVVSRTEWLRIIMEN